MVPAWVSTSVSSLIRSNAAPARATSPLQRSPPGGGLPSGSAQKRAMSAGVRSAVACPSHAPKSSSRHSGSAVQGTPRKAATLSAGRRARIRSELSTRVKQRDWLRAMQAASPAAVEGMSVLPISNPHASTAPWRMRCTVKAVTARSSPQLRQRSPCRCVPPARRGRSAPPRLPPFLHPVAYQAEG